MEKKAFMLMDEKSIGYQGELITILEYENENYAVYAIDSGNSKSNVYVSIIEKDERGQDVLKSIPSENKDKILQIVKELLSVK